MNIIDKMRKMTPFDIFLFVLFLLYIVLPVETPSLFASTIHSPLGLLTIFTITMVLFIYMNPLLAVLYVFVAYELLQRSTRAYKVAPPRIQSTISSSQPIHKPVLAYQRENIVLPQQQTLEEDVVQKMAPIGHSDPAIYISTSYKPIAENVGSASLF
jgi:predicted membrane protein